MATRETSGSNIDTSIIARVTQGLKYIISGVGPDAWFGPNQPLAPTAQDKTEGRGWDYPVGLNLRQTPRSTEVNPFYLMRSLADGYDLLRSVIETRKDQIKSFDWELVPTDEAVDAETLKDQIKLVSDFLQCPDGEHAWDDWLSMLVEDLLVIDAVAIYPALNKGGKVMSLELIDAATITRKINEDGRTPLPPDPAYQQVLHGVPANDLTRDQLIYMMRNPRTNRLYGFSPVEQIMMTVNIALRRQMSQLEFYTAGNVPEALAQTPETWTPKQVADFQLLWDSLNEGNTAQRRKMRFVPKLDNIVFPKHEMLKDEYDEWLARIVCFAFSIPPTAFIKQNNRATGQQAAETAKEEGLMPLMKWLQTKINFIVSRHLGHPELKFKWKMEANIDPLVQAQIDQILTSSRIKTPAEVREDMGMDALTPAEQEEAWPPPPVSQPTPVEGKGGETPTTGAAKTGAPAGGNAEKFHIVVNPPEIHLGDTFVRVGDTSAMTKNVA